jgi:hypothetical protein
MPNQLPTAVLRRPRPLQPARARPTPQGNEPQVQHGKLEDRVLGKAVDKGQAKTFSKLSAACPLQRSPICKKAMRS